MPLIDDVRAFTGLQQQISSLTSRLEELSRRIAADVGIEATLVPEVVETMESFASVRPSSQDGSPSVETSPAPSAPTSLPVHGRPVGPVELGRIIRECVFRPDSHELPLGQIVERLHQLGVSGFNPERFSSFEEFVRFVVSRQSFGFDKPLGNGSDEFCLARPIRLELRSAISEVLRTNPSQPLAPHQIRDAVIRSGYQTDTDEVRRTLSRMASSSQVRVHTSHLHGSRKRYSRP